MPDPSVPSPPLRPGGASSAFRPGWFLLLAAAGVAGNVLGLRIGFHIDFLFGSVAGLLAVSLLGTVPGVAVAVIAASWTFVSWNHPYGIVILGCEALWVGLVRRSRPGAPLFLVDLAYWLVLGAPLVLAFYGGVMHVDLRIAGTIALKQSLNGVTNAVVASILLDLVPFWRWAGSATPPVRRTSTQLFDVISFLLLVPAIGGLVAVNYRDLRRSERNLALRVKDAGSEVEWLLTRWLNEHRRAVELLAEQGASAGFKATGRLQRQAGEVHRLFPDFYNVFVADADATTVAFDPPVNARGEPTIGLNFSDRDWYQRLRTTGKVWVSDVFRARGGVFDPIVTIAVPVETQGRLDGLAVGAVNPALLQARTREIAAASDITVTILDRKGAVITSTDPRRPVMTRLALDPSPGADLGVPGVQLMLPPAASNVGRVQAWSEASLFTSLRVDAAGWTVLVEGPLAPIQQSVYDTTGLNSAAIFLLLLVGNAASLWFTRRLSRPLVDLARTSVGIPEKIETQTEIAWPVAETEETRMLVSSLRATSEALRDKLRALGNKADENARLVSELQGALQQVKTLEGLLPICMYCHKIRDEAGHWARIESYISARTNANFSHGMCPACAKERFPDE